MLFFTYQLSAANSCLIPIDSLTTEKDNLLPFSTIYESTDDLDIITIDSLITHNKLVFAKQQASQGFSQKYYWIQFNIDWTNKTIPYLLELDNPHIDHVALYQKTEDKFTKIGHGGDRDQTFKDRSYINRRFIFPLINTNTQTTYFLMVDKRNASVSFPIWLWKKSDFESTESKQNIFFSVYFGIIFFFGITSLFTAVVIRKKVFFYYASYILSMSLYLFTALGFSFQFLYPNSENFNNYSRVILSVIIVLFTTLFLRCFLNIDKIAPKISRYFKVVNILLIVLTLSWICFAGLYKTYTIWLLNLSNIIFISIFICTHYAAYKAYKTKKTNVIVFFTAFSTMIIGVMAYLAVEYGVISEDIFSLNPILLGTGFEIVILSFLMIYQLIQILNTKTTLELQNQILEKNSKSLKAQNIELKKETEEFKNTSLRSKENILDNPKNIVLKSKAVLQLQDITHISSDSHYLEFYLTTKDNPEIDRNTFKNILNQLPETNFIQVHRSHIVNIDFLKIIKASELILKNGKSIPISRSFKTQVKELIVNS
ncbi:7TM diverse intracellular signaling domain-containing protein [Flavobacterium ovatum]|uniref:7TM diverse intracellular signaling domain-containing protein n=1 Tax=Flavobacterium ovatum TaxID=1928857 RepID=UPI00344B16E7